MTHLVAGIEIYIPFLTALGFMVGVLGGFFGIGGAFIATPALNLLGFPMVYAIGTDLAQICGSSVFATLRHRRLGNVDFRLGLLMLAGTVFGVALGKEAVLLLEAWGWVEGVVRGIYFLLLFGLGAYIIWEYAAHERSLKGELGAERLAPRLSRQVRSLRLPPFVDCPVSGIRAVSLWVLLGVGGVTGFLAGFLGVGGGFIRMPALVYTLGVPTTIAIGTDLFEIILSSAAGTILYAMEGRVDFAAAGWMLVGAIPGAQLGASATRYVRGIQIRLYFALTVLCAGLAVGLKQVGSTLGVPIFGHIAMILLLGTAAGLTGLVLVRYAVGFWQERRIPAFHTPLRVLVACDGSPVAREAAVWAGRLAAMAETQPTVAVVAEAEGEEIARSWLSAAGETARRAGALPCLLLLSGKAAPALQQEIRAGYDVLVLAARSTRAPGLGNVARQIVETTSLPALLVRPTAPRRHLLVAVRPWRWTERLAEWIGRLASGTGSRVTVLAVQPRITLYGADHGEVDLTLRTLPREQEQAQQCIRILIERFGMEVRRISREGIPEEEILLEAATGEYDLLVVRSRPGGGLPRWLREEAALTIVRRAPISVFLLR